MRQIRRQSNRRGAALLLVLIALGVSVVLAAAFLDSRNNSIPMADGLSRASQVRRAANSSLELALASIANDPNWITAQESGVLADGFSIDGARIRIDIKDLDTGGPPTADTHSISILATAMIDGVEISAETMTSVAPQDPPLNLAFDEVALLARDQVRLSDDAILMPWLANASKPGPADPVLLGTFDGDPAGVQFEQNALAANSVQLNVDHRGIRNRAPIAGRRTLPEALPPFVLRMPPAPLASPSGEWSKMGPHTGDVDAATVRIRAGEPLRITGDSVIRSRGSMHIEPGAHIIIENGLLVLDAEENFTITRARIETGPNGKLSIVVRRHLEICDSLIAPLEVDPDPLGTTPPNDDVQLLTLRDAGNAGATITIVGSSRLMATILAPDTHVSIRGNTVLYGRILAARIHALEHAAIFARPDDGASIGLTAIDGPHRDEDGLLLAAVAGEDRLAPTAMAFIAEALAVAVASTDDVIEPAGHASRAAERAARRVERRAHRPNRSNERRGWNRRHWNRP